MGGGQPESQSMQARLWEGHSTKPEGWETTMYATYAATAVIIAFGCAFAPDSTIQSVSVVGGNEWISGAVDFFWFILT